ncbi:energy transducer TonB [Flavobacterium sp.]|uniref:energy transducer TonB n=1 Tax=Flavobacterium sp. TaxID=239 RepID=UPI0039E3CAE5
MKQLILVPFAVFSQNLFSQDLSIQTTTDSIYSDKEVDLKPEAIGGKDKMNSYIMKHYQLPDEQGLNGKVIVSFVVEKDGSVSDYQIVQDVGFNTGTQLLEILRKFDRWKPGQKNGIPVRVRYHFPLNVMTAQ